MKRMSRTPPHKWLLIIDDEAKIVFDELPLATKLSFVRSLMILLRADDPYSVSFVGMLKDKEFERMRKFRAGDWRILFVVERSEITHLQHKYAGTLFLQYI